MFKFSHRISVTLLIVITLSMVSANPLEETIGPLDLLMSHAGWKNLSQENISVRNHNRSDVIDTIIPNIEQNQSSLWENGTINLSNLIKVTSIPYYLVKDDSLAFLLTVYFKIFLLLYGSFLFFGLFLINKTSIIFSAMSFTFCEFNIGWLFWDHVNVTIWLPFLFWSTIKYLRTNHKSYLFLNSIFTLLIIIAWFPSVAAYLFYSLGTFIITFSIWHKNINFQKVGAITFSYLLGFGLSAFYLIDKAQFFGFIPNHSDQNSIDLSYRSYGSTFQLNHLHKLYNIEADGLPMQEFSLYTGVIPLLLILIIPLVLPIIRVRQKMMLYFSYIMIVISMVIIYELIDRDILKIIPTFSFNLWNRASMLTSFGISICSGIILDSILNIKQLQNKNSLRLILSIVLLLFHFLDLQSAFHKYNRVVPKDWFYPASKSIEYVKNNLYNSTNYILADRTFMVSGTLRYYGLKDWFSHGFKTQSEKNVLNELIPGAFKTPTAAYFSINQISNYCSSLFDLMNIQFILSDVDIAETIDINPFGLKNKQPEDLFNKKSVEQNVSFVKEFIFNEFEILFATYHMNPSNIDGIRIKLLNAAQKPLFDSLFTDLQIYDNKFFLFEMGLDLNSQCVTKIVLTPNLKNSQRLAIWTNEQNNWIAKFKSKQTQCNVFDNWKKIEEEDGLFIYENLTVPNGPYIISTGPRNQPNTDFKYINSSDKSDEITISIPEISSSETTNFVVPTQNDVRFYKNGVETPSQFYLGFLPTINIKSHDIITYVENPQKKWFNPENLISFLSLIIILFLFKSKFRPKCI